MADEGDVLTDLNMDPATGANGADTQPSAGVISQYIKDLSVENPNAPACFQWTEQPQLDVQVNIAADKVADDVHEGHALAGDAELHAGARRHGLEGHLKEHREPGFSDQNALQLLDTRVLWYHQILQRATLKLPLQHLLS